MKIGITVSKIGFIAMFLVIAPHAVFASEENYGAGFWPSPSNLNTESSDNTDIHQDNYGAGFTASPKVSHDSKEGDTLTQDNYGNAFTASPTVDQNSTAGNTLTTDNYGAAFTSSPTIVHTFNYRTIPANYGAGFRTFGVPWSWSGAGYRIYSLGWWF